MSSATPLGAELGAKSGFLDSAATLPHEGDWLTVEEVTHVNRDEQIIEGIATASDEQKRVRWMFDLEFFIQLIGLLLAHLDSRYIGRRGYLREVSGIRWSQLHLVDLRRHGAVSSTRTIPYGTDKPIIACADGMVAIPNHGRVLSCRSAKIVLAPEQQESDLTPLPDNDPVLSADLQLDGFHQLKVASDRDILESIFGARWLCVDQLFSALNDHNVFSGVCTITDQHIDGHRPRVFPGNMVLLGVLQTAFLALQAKGNHIAGIQPVSLEKAVWKKAIFPGETVQYQITLSQDEHDPMLWHTDARIMTTPDSVRALVTGFIVRVA